MAKKRANIRVSKTQDPIEWFMSFVFTDPNSGCWLWGGAHTHFGHGHVRWEGRTQCAHRVSYILHIGPIPKGLVLDHLCKNPACVNPRHLEPVTQAINIERSDARDKHFNAAKTSCKHGHPFNEENTYIIPSGVKKGKRSCRACKTEKARKYRNVKKALGMSTKTPMSELHGKR